MRNNWLKVCLLVMLSFNLVGKALDTQLMEGDFLGENKKIEGSWWGGKNFTPKACSHLGFYLGRAHLSAVVDQIRMDLSGDNEMNISATLRQGYGRIEGEYLGDLSACLAVSGWLGVGTESIDVKAKVKMSEENSNVTVKVYHLKFGRLNLGRYCPEFLTNFLTDSLNKAFVYIWETQVGDWVNKYLTDYFNSLKDKRGI